MDEINQFLDVVDTPCTAIFSGQTGCGKTKLMLDLLQNEYKKHFENIVILCSTLKWNTTYKEINILWSDDHIFLIDPKQDLFAWIEELSTFFENESTLFAIDDMIADKNLDKRRQPLLKLAISGRHKNHSLWLLTQSYTAIPKDLRRQCKMLFVWHPNHRSNVKLIDEETNLIDDWSNIKKQLKQSKHACLFIRLEFPSNFKIVS
jgi:hypothetical protein